MPIDLRSGGGTGDAAGSGVPGTGLEADPGKLSGRAAAARRALPWALFALALAAAVVFALLWQRSTGAERRRSGVQSAATRFLQALTNFQAGTISADVQRIRSFAVGDFSDQVRTFFGPATVAAITTSGVQSTGQVQSVFVESLAGSTATVFGVVNQTVTNSKTTAPRAEVVRIEIQMIDTSGGWKVSRVDVLQSPTAGPLGSGP